jgi:hypothetical protein
MAAGIFILVRLRAEPVEDKEDERRRRSVEESLGLGKPAEDVSIPPNLSVSSLHFRRMDELQNYRVRQNFIRGAKVP